MSVPETRVYVLFNIELVDVEFFTLNDATKGLLNGTYPLGGDALVDVTQFVQSVSIDRGKSRELDRFAAGNATVVFHNDNRWFDPFYTASPYYQQFEPRRKVVITTNGLVQFTGFIDDIDISYQLGNKSFARISCVDGFIQLSSAQLESFTNVEQLPGARITAILNRPEVNWPLADRNLDTGVQLLQDDTVQTGTNALSYLQTVEQSEPGSLFIAKDGKLTFKDRVNTPPVIEDVAFTDDGSVNSIAYNNIEVVYGSENLYNRVVITRVGGTAQVADDVASQALYGIQSLSQDNLLMNSDENALVLAEYLVDQYSTPELRFSTLSFTLHDKTEAEQNKILNLEINDAVRIAFTPNNIGDPISEYALITGIKHRVGIDQHYVDINFGEITNFPFILDDAVYGVLSGNVPVYSSPTATYDEVVNYEGELNETYPLAF